MSNVHSQRHTETPPSVQTMAHCLPIGPSCWADCFATHNSFRANVTLDLKENDQAGTEETHRNP